MLKIGEFIYPWGSGHYSRMMRLNEVLNDMQEEITSLQASLEQTQEDVNIFFLVAFGIIIFR